MYACTRADKNMAEDIATGKLVALKSHRLTIDTAGATTRLLTPPVPL